PSGSPGGASVPSGSSLHPRSGISGRASSWAPGGSSIRLLAMSLDPRLPVLVGAADVSQRFDDPHAARSAIELMVHACEEAAADAGNPDLLRAAQVIAVPTGTWQHPNAAGAVAAGIGNATARTVRAELGILQTTLFRHTCNEIASGSI